MSYSGQRILERNLLRRKLVGNVMRRAMAKKNAPRAKLYTMTQRPSRRFNGKIQGSATSEGP